MRPSSHRGGVCPGDSGGPQLQIAGTARILSGVASFTVGVNNTGPCTSVYTSYHVAVNPNRPWINTSRALLDPLGACVGNDSATFATLDGGCLQRDYSVVWSDRAAVNRNRPQAIAYCNALVEGGKDDWRLPTEQDLLFLYGSGGAAALCRHANHRARQRRSDGRTSRRHRHWSVLHSRPNLSLLPTETYRPRQLPRHQNEAFVAPSRRAGWPADCN